MRRKRNMGMRLLLTVAAMASVLAVAACEGENLFSVPGTGGPAGEDTRPPEVSISVPRGDTLSGTAVNDSVYVSVHLTDRVGVRSVRMYGIARRGDPNLGTLQTVERFEEKTITLPAGVKDTTLNRYLLSTGDTLRETAYVVVEAMDSVGNAAVDTASLAVGGPKVFLPGLVEDSTISAGVPFGATIVASDRKGVNRVSLIVTGAINTEVVKTLGTSLDSTKVDTAFAIPDTVSGPISIRATGRNTLGVVERSDPIRLFIADKVPPKASILLPRGDSLSAKPLGDSVFVRARFTDNFGVRSIRFLGYAHRGDRDLGTDSIVPRFVERAITLPAGVKDTTITRYLRATPDSTKEIAYIQVIVADSAGNQAKDSVRLVLGGPDVAISEPLNGSSIPANSEMSFLVQANDPSGILGLTISTTGAVDTVLTFNYSPARDTVNLATVLFLPESAVGPMQITVVARNSLNVSGQDGPITVNVIASDVGDTVPPVVLHSSTAPERMEIQDSVEVKVVGSDQGGGVARIGYTALAISPTRGDTLVRTDSVVYDPPRGGNVTKFFRFGTFNVDSLSLPDTLVYEVTTWMRDAKGNCAASVGQDSLVSLPCDTLPTGETVAEGRLGGRLVRTTVAGKTVLLPAGGRIMDAAVDPVRKRMFLSNIVTNRLDVFDLAADRFLASIGVGSEPWGLSLNRTGDSLWVANSGGTNLSVVDLSGLREADKARLLTPDVNLFELTLKVGESGAQWTVDDCPNIVAPCSFSDRPQFVAVDSFKNVIYSTKVTGAGAKGTARKAFFLPGMVQPEVKLFIDHARTADSEDIWTITHADAVAETAADAGIEDHIPGDPTNKISVAIPTSDPYTGLAQAELDLQAQGSDVRIRGGKLIYEDFLYEDTTFVAASGDGAWIVVGEGSASPLGRVFTYRAAQGDTTPLTALRQTTDLLNNAAEEVRGVGVNYDGSSAVIRGSVEAYFISPEDLRSQGTVRIPAAGLGAGAALHPLHADARSLQNPLGGYFPDTHLAFVGSGERTIEIIDTWRFTRIGRVYLRDNIVGPLRAVLPFPEDNVGLTCGTLPVMSRTSADGSVPRRQIGEAVQIYRDPTDFTTPLIGDETITQDKCVVVKLFGATAAGGVVVVDVRKADIFREHPDRP